MVSVSSIHEISEAEGRNHRQEAIHLWCLSHGGAWLALLICCLASTAFGQSSVFNIPSTDTQEEKTFYVEGDFYSHFGSFQQSGFRGYGPVVVYGLKKNLEVGGNVLYIRSGSDPTLEFQPNIKWKFHENDKSKIAISAGAIGFVPLNKATGTQPSIMLYTNLSKTVESAKELRVTAGVYAMAGARSDFGSKKGIMLGLEQPITQKWTILADWFSGDNRFGYSTIGTSFQLTSQQYVGAGYSFGNVGRGNNYFTAFYGFTF